MAYAQPNQVAINSLVPFGARGLDQATWVAGASKKLLDGIVNQAIQLGDASRVGMPASWPYGPIQNEDILAGGKASPILEAKVQQYVNSTSAQSDQDFNTWVGANYSSASPGGYQDAPLSPAEQLAREQFEYTKAQNALKLATGGGTSATRVSSANLNPRVSSGGGGSSADDDLAARTAAAKELAQQEFELKKELMMLQFQLDNDPNNPKLQLQRDQMAQELSMFQQSLSQKEQSEQRTLQQERARTIADYSANPGDAVAREYFLRQQGAEPLGTPIDIFTGQQTGDGLATLSELMRKQAPLTRPYISAQVTGAPPPTAPPPPPPESTPVPEDTPAFAMGTDRITPDGWTRANKFITGDHPSGMANPELNQVRVRNGHAETKVTPLSRMVGGMPRFAGGTEWGLKTETATPQSLSYEPSRSTSHVYNESGQSNITFGDTSNPYVVNSNSGVPYNANMATSDPYFGTPYQGMKASDLVTNANSPFYGQTVEAANQANIRQNALGGTQELGGTMSLNEKMQAPLTVVGPTGGMTTGGWTGADPYAADGDGANAYLEQIYYDGAGYARPINNVNRQSDAGILTGAQMSNGVTQSGNPGAPNYTPPEGWPTAPQPKGNLEDDNIQRPMPQEGAPQDGQAGGPTNEPTGINTIPGSSVQTKVINPQGYEEVLQAGTVNFNGATFDVKPGDYRTPDGKWLRFNPILNDYSPLMPSKVTEITSEDQFWGLPDAERQKILTGQPTGYSLVENGPNQWRTGLLAGLGTPNGNGVLSKQQFMALPDDEKMKLLNAEPPTVMGSGLPSQTQEVYNNGPLRGQLSSLISLMNPQGAMSSGQPLSYFDYFKNGANDPEAARILMGEQGYKDFMWKQGNDYFNKLEAEKAAAAQPTTAPATGGGATTTPTTGTSGTTPATGGTGASGGTGTTTPATGGTPPATGGGQSLSDILAALSYGGDIYQNLPILKLLSGQMTQADYDTIASAPVEVPGLGVSLPSANQAANYATLAQLQQTNPDAFALLNSLYTAGNVPLSAIMAFAKSRAPLGSAYETSLVSTQ